MTKKLTLLTIVAILLFSCKDKEAEKLKRKQEKEKHQKAKVIELNKDFIYNCYIISSKTKLPLDIVKLVLKKYFEDKEDFVFKSNSFVVLNDDNWKHERRHILDLIKETSKEYAIPFDNVVKIYSVLEFSEKIEDLEDEISYLDSTIQELEYDINKGD